MTNGKSALVVLAGCLVAMVAGPAWAQTARHLTLDAGFSQQSVPVRVETSHNLQENTVLRTRGCVGFVTTEPQATVSYRDQGTGGAVVVRAESATDLVLLVGTRAGSWYCNDNADGTNPAIRLPAGSDEFSVWVGTRQRGAAQGTLVVAETAGTRPAVASGRCGEARARIPDGLTTEDWGQFVCTGQEQAGDRWGSCYARTAYSDSSGDGCPGAERCCPPANFRRSEPAAASAGTNQTTTNQATQGQAAASPAAGAGSAAQTHGRCGGSLARLPAGVGRDAWAAYSCMGEAQAGGRWSSCVGRATYSDQPADGCPGAELCCPGAPAAARPATTPATPTSASATGTAATGTAATGTAATGTAATGGQASSGGSQAQQAAAGSAASRQGPPALARTSTRQVIEGTPWGTAGGTITVHWRGFPDARLNVHQLPNASSALAFAMPAAALPARVGESRVIVEQPRRLRAQRAGRLSIGERSVDVAESDVVELYLRADASRCWISAQGVFGLSVCPAAADYGGIDGPYQGPSPDRYEWWIEVSLGGQTGWLRVDPGQPEFAIELP